MEDTVGTRPHERQANEDHCRNKHYCADGLAKRQLEPQRRLFRVLLTKYQSEP